MAGPGPLRPEIERYLAETDADAPAPREAGVDEARAFHERSAPIVSGPGEPVARVWQELVPGPDGPIEVRCYAAVDEPAGALLYLHGGGWVIGSAQSFDSFSRALANATGWLVATVDYRLAPEHPFPAAVEDSWAALRWLAEDATVHGVSSGRLAVGGDSAGGNLAAVVARRARDSGGPPVERQVLLNPVTDPRMDSDSYRDLGEGHGLSREAMEWFWEQYLQGADPETPDVAPARWTDLAGLPSALVLTASHDPLRDEGEDFAHRLAAAGVPVQLERMQGVLHGFGRQLAVTPVARHALARIAAWLG
ncbi:MAG: esterase [Solirubrobacterales bacterium]|nr:esterase [Solirubrobacterales bacterium]